MGDPMIQLKHDLVEVPETKNPTSLEICLCIWPKNKLECLHVEI